MKKLIALVAVVAFLASAAPALAGHGHHWSSSDITVSNSSSASVTNNVNTSANTGYNTANGGSASNTVSGSGHHWHHGGGSSNCDNDATGGEGGYIDTGNAEAGSSVITVANTNITRVRR